MFKSISNKNIYDNTSLSFVFEFYTPLNKREASAKFARALGKKIKWFKEVGSSFEATNETFKISPIYSNGYKEVSLSTGFLPYGESIHMFLKIMNIIESIGYTNDRCSVVTKIRLNEQKLDLPIKLEKLNKFKYLLGINEKALFNLWPQSENESKKIYQNHLQFIQPRDIYNTIITENFIEKMNPVEFKFPESDFFANDFSELGKGNMVIKYISGKDYTTKKKESIETINLVIEHLYNTLLHNYEYTGEEKKRISKIVNEFRNSIDGTKSYFNFKRLYPNVHIYVDLKPNKFLIESNYIILREKIFKVLVGGGITEAIINYDTHRKAIQVKDAKINKSILIEGVEFYQCEIEADAKGCLFESCEIKNSKLVDCIIYSNNYVKNSKVLDCDYFGTNNEIKSSYLDNSENKVINANLRECLVNRGKFSLDSSIDENTKILEKLG
jgi:hypothetical protein